MSNTLSSWSIGIILLLSRTILTQNIVKQPLGNFKNYESKLNSINLDASDFVDSKETKEDFKDHDEDSESVHSRQKRMVWITDDGRLALPPGTTLIIVC